MSASEVVVRGATRADAPEVARLLGELGYPASPNDADQRLARLLARSDQHVLIAELVSRAGRSVVGVLVLHVYPAITQSKDIAVIMALSVSELTRGTGVGRLLVERAEAIARECGAGRLMVTTHNRRVGAHTFYERLGFEFTGRRYVKGVG